VSRLTRAVLAIGMMLCFSAPVWAGNWACQFTGYGTVGHGFTATEACQDAAKVVCPAWVATQPASSFLSCNPHPLDDDPNGSYGICTSAGGICMAGSHLCTTYLHEAGAPPFLGCNSGPTVASNSQASTGTTWGNQYGSPHTYDSQAGSTPDVITYVGPEDGNISIEVEANHGLNSTSVTAVSLTNAQWGNSVGTVTHVQSSPYDIWQVSGSVSPLSNYNLSVTFSHTGGYGEYSVRMNGTARPSTLPALQWTPVLYSGASSSGFTYTQQTGQYTIENGWVHATFTIALSAKPSGTGRLSIQGLPAPDVGTCGGGGYTTGKVGFTGVGSLGYEVCSGIAYIEDYSGGTQVDVNNGNLVGNGTYIYGELHYPTSH
jgi:hypothetical protein